MLTPILLQATSTNGLSKGGAGNPLDGLILLQISTTNVMGSLEHFKEKVVDLSTEYGMKVIGAIVIFVVGYLIVRWLTGMFARWLEKQQLEPPVKMLFRRVVRLFLILGVLVASVQNVMPITPLLAGIGVAGVGVGLALQGVLSNLVAGLTIIFTKPYRVGEYIHIAGVHGQVVHIELFSTVLVHNDLSKVVIPNRKIVGEILHNYGKIRQLPLTVGVAYGTDLDEAFKLLKEILAANARVLKDPAAGVGIVALTDSSVTIGIYPWVALADYGPTQVELYQAVVKRFKEQSIKIQPPQREVRLLNAPPEQ